MGVLKHDVKVPATPERVWDSFADLNRLPEWLTLHVKFKSAVPTADEYRVGLQVSQVLSVLGMPNTVEWTVEEYTPLRSVTLAGTGMAGVKVKFVFAVSVRDGWTYGSLHAEFTGQILVGPIGKAVEKEVDKHLRESLGKLADLLAEEGVITAAERDKVEFIAPAPSA
jgi:carbon monoxide dehydrogenase subunit G